MMKRYIILLLCLFVGTVSMMGQTKQAYLNAAQNAYEQEDYYSALSYYQEVLEFEEDDPDIYYQAANAARQFRAYTFADTLYAKVLEEEDNNQFPKATFYAAEIKQKLGQYDKAKEYYSLYISEQSGVDTFLTRKAKKEIEAIDWALKQIENSDPQKDTTERLGNVNSPYSEFGAYMLNDTMFFSSLRFEKEQKDEHPNKIYSRIMVAEDSTDNGAIFGEDLSSTEYKHIAHSTFNEDNSRMYFTLCEYITADEIRCDLYSVKMDSGKITGEPHKLSNKINNDTLTSTEPAWGMINDSTEVLYFVSDRKGGKGKKDIWYTEIEGDSSYSEPVNLQTINTADNDITPFYDRSTSSLYFSSEGYLGFGGYDIYSSQNTESGWTDPFNVGTPLNGSYDDVYPMIDGKTDKMYFSSNRKGSMYLEKRQEACCYDIYKGELPYLRHELIVQVFDQDTRDSIYGAEVSLKIAENNELIKSQQHPDSTQYPFKVQRNKEYNIEGLKEGYLPEEVTFSTVNVPDTADIIKKLFLKTEELNLDVYVYDARDSMPLRGAEVTVVDSEGTSRDTINLDANDFHFELDRDNDYTIIASRKGFRPVSVKLDPDNYRNKSRIRKDLYLPVGQLKDFLPLVLYFDNDRPNPNTWARTTEKLYTETFLPYYNKKDSFINVYTDPLTGEEEDQASNKLDNFFDTEVMKGNDDLQSFMVVLERELNEGKDVEIFLKGYTSPRASRAYNYALGMRRVQSVRNNLIEYEDGALRDFIRKGQLEVKLKSFGETTSPENVPDDLSDERESIFSYDASKERRVEIIGVNIEE